MKTTFFFLLLTLIFTVTHSAKFNIASTSTCTSTSAVGFCTKWEQNGTVIEETAACFTSDMFLKTRQGLKPMNQIQLNDEVLSFDREKGEVYTRVRGWLHRDQTSKAQFMKIIFENGQILKVSDKHNIAFVDDSLGFTFMFASEISEELKLYGSNNSVKSIDYIEEDGVYAPMTFNSNYFVYSSGSENSSRILAHDFASIKSPESYEPIANMIFSIYQTFSGKSQSQGIHPAANWMMGKFSFLME